MGKMGTAMGKRKKGMKGKATERHMADREAMGMVLRMRRMMMSSWMKSRMERFFQMGNLIRVSILKEKMGRLMEKNY